MKERTKEKKTSYIKQKMRKNERKELKFVFMGRTSQTETPKNRNFCVCFVCVRARVCVVVYRKRSFCLAYRDGSPLRVILKEVERSDGLVCSQATDYSYTPSP
jgi:hypothetical protein